MAKINLSLNMPTSLWAYLTEMAQKQNVSTIALIQEFIKLGMVAVTIQEDPDSALLIQEGDKVRELILFTGELEGVANDGR